MENTKIQINFNALRLMPPTLIVEGSRVQIPESKVQSPRSRVQGLESRVQSPESRVQGPESRVQGPESIGVQIKDLRVQKEYRSVLDAIYEV